MSKNLSMFFAENAETKDTIVEYVASTRFKDENGEPVAWELKPLSADTIKNMRKQFTTKKKVKGQTVEEFDSTGYTNELVLETVQFPNLRAVDLLESYQVKHTPTEILFKMLIAGEYDKLANRVSEVNGYGEDINEAIEDAKN